MTATTDRLGSEIEALRKARQVLARKRDELEQRVLELTEALENATAEAARARAQADEADLLNENLLLTVSHELRTPLQGMLSWSQILARVVRDPARVRHAAERIIANVDLQARMLDELLDYSRVLSGKLNLKPQRIELTSLIREVADAMIASATERNISLEAEIADAPLWIRADPARMEQVLRSLASNAVDAVDAGGRARIECVADATHVIVRVQDWGAGIDGEDLLQLFEPFRKARRSSKPHPGRGLGLGLAIARHIVELSGGEISVCSDGLECGTMFTLRLPRAADAPPEPRFHASQ